YGVGGAAGGAMRGRAATAAVLLCALFVVVYGFCNWVTSLRGGVGSFYFGWERRIPFVALLIVPYMSIDLFFVGAPFLARTRGELRVFAWRIVAVIWGGGVCFLLWPLRFGFERPQVEGALGLVFN